MPMNINLHSVPHFKSFNQGINFRGTYQEGYNICEIPQQKDQQMFERLSGIMNSLICRPDQTVLKDFFQLQSNGSTKYTFKVDLPAKYTSTGKNETARFTMTGYKSGGMDVLIQNANTTDVDSEDGYSFNTTKSGIDPVDASLFEINLRILSDFICNFGERKND